MREVMKLEGKKSEIHSEFRIQNSELHTTAAARAATAMRNRSGINDGIEVESGRLESANGLFPSRTETFDLHRDGLDAKRSRFQGGGLGGDFGGVRRRLAGSLESGRTGRAPAEHASFEIGERNDGVVLRSMNADAGRRHGALYLLAAHFRLGLASSRCFDRGVEQCVYEAFFLVVGHERK